MTKVDIFGVGVDVTDYSDATSRVMEAARNRRSYAVSALAVHGLMEAVGDDAFRSQVNEIDLVTPDGQPVRWAMNLLHDVGLEDRVYGPDLTWHVISACEDSDVSLFLFGSKRATIDGFVAEIRRRHPRIRIAGTQADRFRDATPDEDEADIRTINESGAGVVLVGRGCPRQERWVADHRGRVDAAMMAVGAAFDYGAGTLDPPPRWMQRSGLQWAFRLRQEPGRLWRRYLVTNSRFMWSLGGAMLQRRR